MVERPRQGGGTGAAADALIWPPLDREALRRLEEGTDRGTHDDSSGGQAPGGFTVATRPGGVSRFGPPQVTGRIDAQHTGTRQKPRDEHDAYGRCHHSGHRCQRRNYVHDWDSCHPQHRKHDHRKRDQDTYLSLVSCHFSPLSSLVAGAPTERLCQDLDTRPLDFLHDIYRSF